MLKLERISGEESPARLAILLNFSTLRSLIYICYWVYNSLIIIEL